MSVSFTVSSGEIAVGNPLGEFQRCELPARNPGIYRLAPEALVRIEDDSQDGIQVDDELVYAWDVVFTDALAAALRKHHENCAGDAAVMVRNAWQLRNLTGTKIGCYRVRYACDESPPGRYQLTRSKVVRSSAWRFGVRETAGRLNLAAIFWSFSLSYLAAGFLCFLGLSFAIAAVGCTVQHFVDPDAIWNRDPVRGVVEPLSWACMSAFAIGAGVCLFRKKYIWAIAMIVPIGMIATATTSMFGI